MARSKKRKMPFVLKFVMFMFAMPFIALMVMLITTNVLVLVYGN
jgi:hypothetical protein